MNHSGGLEPSIKKMNFCWILNLMKNPWLRHQMEIFPHYWPFGRGIHRSPVNSPDKGQWRGALMFSLICVWINGWVNIRKAGDLRRFRAHYDVIVMHRSNLSRPDIPQTHFVWRILDCPVCNYQLHITETWRRHQCDRDWNMDQTCWASHVFNWFKLHRSFLYGSNQQWIRNGSSNGLAPKAACHHLGQWLSF